MGDTIDIMGKPVKKPVVIGAGVGVLVIAGILYSRAKKAQAAAAVPSDPSATAATDTSGIDPATGLTLGSAEDLAALSSQSAGYYGTNSAGNTTSTPQGFSNNAQWAQAAESYITGESGGQGASDPVGNALGKYITGQDVTSDQKSIGEQAIAFEGYPPVPGTDGYPPHFREVATPPAKTTQVAVPNVKGMDVQQAGVTLKAAGLKMSGPAGVAHKTHVVQATSPAIGSKVNTGSTVKISKYTTK